MDGLDWLLIQRKSSSGRRRSVLGFDFHSVTVWIQVDEVRGWSFFLLCPSSGDSKLMTTTAVVV